MFLRALTILALSLPIAAATPPRVILNASVGGPSRYIVALDDDVDDVSAAADALTRGRHRDLRALHGFIAEMSAPEAAALLGQPGVKYVEQDSTGGGGSFGTPSALTTQIAPPGWGLDRIDQRDLPFSGSYLYYQTGRGVTAYILDSGINATHHDFGTRVRTGYDANPATPGDCNGHGTHVSGIVGGSTYGVAKEVSLVSLRVLDCTNRGFVSDMIDAINWAIADHQTGQPAVMNISIYTDTPSVAFDNAIKAAIADGITVCVLAGNGTANNGVPADACSISPARVPAAITVSATSMTDTKASFANFGACVDLFAPGVQIESAWYSSNTAAVLDSGTSMATPHVSGAAALYLQNHPDAAPATVASALVAAASMEKVLNAGTGSPNRLLFTTDLQVPSAPRRHAVKSP